MTRRYARLAVFAGVFLLTAGFDQGTKEWARTLPDGVPQPVIHGFWDWELAHNPGAAFSSFTGGTVARVVLSLLAIVALGALAVAAARTRPDQRLRRIAYALIAGGALGNLIDRVRDGAVTDFVRWRIHEHRWPIFNLADAALLVGGALLVLESLRVSWQRRRAA
jgi:signal peptidase II